MCLFNVGVQAEKAATSQPTTSASTASAPPAAIYGSGSESFQTSPTPYFQGRYYNPNFAVTPTAPINPADIEQQASCVLQIDSDFDPMTGGRTDNQTATALLGSTALRDTAIARLADMKLDQHKDKIFVQAYPTSDKFVRVTVILLKDEQAYAADTASKLIGVLCDSLKSAFEQSIKASAQAAATRSDGIQKQLDAAKQKLADVRSKLRDARDANNTNGYGYGDVDNALNNLMSQKRNADAELSRQRAQLAAVDPTSGPLVTEWDQVVKLRQLHLDELTEAKKQNKATDADVSDAQSKLADAKTSLAQAKTTSRDPNQGYRNNEISSLRASVAQAEDRAKTLDNQIQKLNDPKTRQLVDQIPDLQMQENSLRNDISNLNMRLEQAHRTTNASSNVTITVLDGQSH
ncbi:MAG TPA: hypothetical protein VHS31_10540 [Tepidisphaeraceae bacterium]|nr:hypothetical protein [Tepidisphaeraceae bacterium]